MSHRGGPSRQFALNDPSKRTQWAVYIEWAIEEDTVGSLHYMSHRGRPRGQFILDEPLEITQWYIFYMSHLGWPVRVRNWVCPACPGQPELGWGQVSNSPLLPAGQPEYGMNEFDFYSSLGNPMIWTETYRVITTIKMNSFHFELPKNSYQISKTDIM
jgi:hypothetical protein